MRTWLTDWLVHCWISAIGGGHQCFVLNGLIFLGSIFFFDRAVIPVIHLFGEILQRSFAQGCVMCLLCLCCRVDWHL